MAQPNIAVTARQPVDQTAAPATILIVEDNELNMKLFTDLLSAHGYRVLQARDGAEGLQQARQHHPDLIVMDVQLPGIMSGLDVTRSLKDDGDFKMTPIVAVTAFAMKGDEEQIRAAGCDAYISKPISASNFLKAIKQHLNQQSESAT